MNDAPKKEGKWNSSISLLLKHGDILRANAPHTSVISIPGPCSVVVSSVKSDEIAGDMTTSGPLSDPLECLHTVVPG